MWYMGAYPGVGACPGHYSNDKNNAAQKFHAGMEHNLSKQGPKFAEGFKSSCWGSPHVLGVQFSRHHVGSWSFIFNLHVAIHNQRLQASLSNVLLCMCAYFMALGHSKLYDHLPTCKANNILMIYLFYPAYMYLFCHWSAILLTSKMPKFRINNR